MKNDRDTPGTSGRTIRPEMPDRQNRQLSVVGQVDSRTDTDGAGSAGYNPYDHTPRKLHCAANVNRVVKMQVFSPDAE